MKKTKTFNVGDKVFAKVKGYPAWPAKIVGANGRKYEVNFYGTGETGLIKIEDLFYYLKHKEQFCRNLKRKDYIEAVEQIEAEIKETGTDGNLGDGNDTVKDEPQEKQEKARGRKRKRSDSNNDSKKTTQSANDNALTEESENSIPETHAIDENNETNKSTPPAVSRSGRVIKSKRFSLENEEEEKRTSKRRRSMPETNQPTRDLSKSPKLDLVKEDKEQGNLMDTSEPPKVDEEKKSAEKDKNVPEEKEHKDEDKNTVDKAPEEKVKQKDLKMDVSEEEMTEEKSEDDKTEMKMPEEEIETKDEEMGSEEQDEKRGEEKGAEVQVTGEPVDVNVISTEYLNTVIAYAEHVKTNAKKFKNQPEEVRNKSENEVILATLPSGQIVGLKYGTNSSKSTSEYDKALSDEEEAKTLLSLKELVEKGDCKLEDDPNMFIINIKVPEDQDNRTIEMTKNKLNLLKIETTLVDCDLKIKASLGLDRAEPKKALEYLDMMAELSITPVMLKKHPLIVDMVKRLKRYVGNAKEWNLLGNALEEFQSDAKKIRAKAEEIFSKFKSLFAVPENASFWDIFNGVVEQFKEDTKDMKESEVFALCAEPFSRQAFFDTHDVKIEIEPPKEEDMLEKENCSSIPNSGSTEEGNTAGLS